MKIMQVLGGDEEGGLEKHVVELSNELAAAGENVVLVAHRKYGPRLGESADFVALDLTRSRRHPIMLWQLLRAIRQQKPDIVHAHGGKATAILGLLGRWVGAPMVATMHGQKRRQRGLGSFSTIITVSGRLAETISHPNVQTVYNGVARQTTPSPELVAELRARYAPSQGKLWLAAGRLVPVKGFDTLIAAFEKVAAGHLLIAGEGPELPRLRERAGRSAVSGQISFLGHRDDVAPLMAASDCVVISSRREGFSYVFAEALMQGRPVVSTDVPIPNEVLPRRLICPPDDPDALARLMSEVDPDSKEQREAQAFARRHLTIDAMVSKTIQVYRKACGDQIRD